jgi:hypothetical protein
VPRLRESVVGLLTILVLGCTATTPGTSGSAAEPTTRSVTTTAGPVTTPTASTTAPAQTTFVAEAGGYTLSVTIDRAQLAPGDTVTFTAAFHNGTSKPIDVAGADCAAAGGYVSVALPVAPEGKAWSGINGTFKDYVLREGYGPGGVPALDPVNVELARPTCARSELSFDLAPGGSVTTKMSWKAEIVRGIGALEGTVPFVVVVAYDQLNGPPSYPPDYTGPRMSWSPMFKQLSVNGAVQVVGKAKALKGPGEIIDAALANRKFAAWLRERPARTWSNANLFLTSPPKAVGIMPKGPAWELDLFRDLGAPRNWAIAFVDPFDANLISVTYCDDPCDR